jgi:hypothetical protein
MYFQMIFYIITGVLKKYLKGDKGEFFTKNSQYFIQLRRGPKERQHLLTNLYLFLKKFDKYKIFQSERNINLGIKS